MFFLSVCRHAYLLASPHAPTFSRWNFRHAQLQMRHIHTLFSRLSSSRSTCLLMIHLADFVFSHVHKLSLVLLFCRCTYSHVRPPACGGYSHIVHCNNTFFVRPDSLA